MKKRSVLPRLTAAVLAAGMLAGCSGAAVQQEIPQRQGRPMEQHRQQLRQQKANRAR